MPAYWKRKKKPYIECVYNFSDPSGILKLENDEKEKGRKKLDLRNELVWKNLECQFKSILQDG